VPAAAVLVWHLLAEVLAPEKWREVRALPANVRGLLREVSAHLAAAKGTDEAPEEWQRLRTRGLAAEHFQHLEKLSEEQLHVLVYLASPAAAESRREAQPGRVDLLDLESAAWVRLEGGPFDMGSNQGGAGEKPVHRVTLSPFRISRYPVTNADYAAYLRDTGRQPPDSWPGGEVPEGKASHPVVDVSWSDAEAFCTWLSRRLGAGGGEQGVVQLPTEAQWEFAARGKEGRKYPWGEEEPDAERANYGGRVGDTTPVGSYPRGATPDGVHDLAGNVWEWCRDWSGPYGDEEQSDPTGPERGASRVLRGGSFHNVPRSLRGAFRYFAHPERRYGFIGFRVVWSRSAGLERA
jgi:formylglycine-generating enzyme required for sulfatase activity